jgi:hypothetical protein
MADAVLTSPRVAQGRSSRPVSLVRYRRSRVGPPPVLRAGGIFDGENAMTDETKAKQPWTPGPLDLAVWDEMAKDPVEMFRNHISHGSGLIWSVWAPNHPKTVGCHPRPVHAVTTCITGNGPTSEANARLYAAAPALAEALAKFVLGYDHALRRGARGNTAPVDPPVIADARALLDACGWQWGGR